MIWFNRIYAYLALAGGFIVTLLFAIFKIRQGGRDAEKYKQTEKTLDNLATAKRIKDDVVGLDDGERNRLRNKWTRK